MVLNSQMACDALGALEERRRGMKGGSKDATGWAARSSRNRRRRRECARQIRQSDGQDKPSDRIDALTDESETLGGWCWVGDGEDEVPSRRQEARDKGELLGLCARNSTSAATHSWRFIHPCQKTHTQTQPITPSSPTSSPARDRDSSERLI